MAKSKTLGVYIGPKACNVYEGKTHKVWTLILSIAEIWPLRHTSANYVNARAVIGRRVYPGC